MQNWTVHTFYKFVPLPDFRQLRPDWLACCRESGLIGTILLAHEGINATVAGSEEGLNCLWEYFKKDPRFSSITPKISFTDSPPFQRMKVRLKKEIVTLGVPGIDPSRDVGIYVKPEAWNQLICDPDVLVVDTRNEYEVKEGTFNGAINPHTSSFREFPQFVETHLDPARTPRIATFCTGGIRCEKATAYLLSRGFKEVYHLQGGILNYLATTPPAKSLWNGHCFVFDERETLDHELRGSKE